MFAAHGAKLSSGVSEPFGHKAQFGYYSDPETGLQLLTHRYYDPATGRFLTRDPGSYAGGINLYSYVANNPLNYIDPSGLDAASQAIPIAGGAVSGGAVAGGAAAGGAVTGAAGAAAPWVVIAGGVALQYYLYWQLGEPKRVANKSHTSSCFISRTYRGI